MTRSCLTRKPQACSEAYASEGCSDAAEDLISKPARAAFADNSVTIGHRYSHIFQQIVDARAAADHDDWDGDGAVAVSPLAVDAAMVLSTAFPQSLPVPAVQPETTGEITFEWYKDSTHVAIISSVRAAHRSQRFPNKSIG